MFKPEQYTTLERKIDRFSRILEENPGDGLTVLALAEASFRRGLKLDALTNYQAVIKESAVPEAHLAVAEIYSQQGMHIEAYGELRELFLLDPGNVEARLLCRVLEHQSSPPDDIVDILNQQVSEASFEESSRRLRIQRTIYNRELQERTRSVSLDPGSVINEYHVEEAKKKLIEVDITLKQLDELREHNSKVGSLPASPAFAPQRSTELTESLMTEDSPPETVVLPDPEQVEPSLIGESSEEIVLSLIHI